MMSLSGHFQPNTQLEYNRKTRVGWKKMANCGLEMEIIAYRNCGDIDVRFSDGTVVEHKMMNSFVAGCIGHPFVKKERAKQINPEEFLGKTKMTKYGQILTIVGYRSSKDIDVQFEDGTLLTHRNMTQFRNDMIAHPVLSRKDFTGLTVRSECGQMMTIIRYRHSNDLDVQFEDGTIAEHKRLQSFRKGTVAHPNRDTRSFKYADKVTGEERMMSCGLSAKIIAVRHARDIDIVFEDGIALLHRNIDAFRQKKISHPHLGTIRKVIKTRPFAEFVIKDIAFLDSESIPYYICCCKQCGYSSVLTAREMLEHHSDHLVGGQVNNCKEEASL